MLFFEQRGVRESRRPIFCLRRSYSARSEFTLFATELNQPRIILGLVEYVRYNNFLAIETAQDHIAFDCHGSCRKLRNTRKSM